MKYSNDELNNALTLLKRMQMDSDICDIKQEPKCRLFFEYVITAIQIQRNKNTEEK